MQLWSCLTMIVLDLFYWRYQRLEILGRFETSGMFLIQLQHSVGKLLKHVCWIEILSYLFCLFMSQQVENISCWYFYFIWLYSLFIYLFFFLFLIRNMYITPGRKKEQTKGWAERTPPKKTKLNEGFLVVHKYLRL